MITLRVICVLALLVSITESWADKGYVNKKGKYVRGHHYPKVHFKNKTT